VQPEQRIERRERNREPDREPSRFAAGQHGPGGRCLVLSFPLVFPLVR
jgi:hypothetical protein